MGGAKLSAPAVHGGHNMDEEPRAGTTDTNENLRYHGCPALLIIAQGTGTSASSMMSCLSSTWVATSLLVCRLGSCGFVICSFGKIPSMVFRQGRPCHADEWKCWKRFVHNSLGVWNPHVKVPSLKVCEKSTKCHRSAELSSAHSLSTCACTVSPVMCIDGCV